MPSRFIDRSTGSAVVSRRRFRSIWRFFFPTFIAVSFWSAVPCASLGSSLCEVRRQIHGAVLRSIVPRSVSQGNIQKSHKNNSNNSRKHRHTHTQTHTHTQEFRLSVRIRIRLTSTQARSPPRVSSTKSSCAISIKAIKSFHCVRSVSLESLRRDSFRLTLA